MRRAQGYAVVTPADGPVQECDTITCAHCNTVVFIKAGQDPSEMGGFCQLCFKHICGPCVDELKCTPFEKKLEVHEARGRFLQAVEDN